MATTCTSNENYDCNRGISSTYKLGDKVSNVGTWEACRELCVKDAACNAWTYGPDGGCYKKTKFVTKYQKGYRSGGKEKMQPTACKNPDNEAYFCDKKVPSDYDLGAAVKQKDWQACRALCLEDSKCAAWSFSPDDMCQKKSADDMITQKGFRSGASDKFSSFTVATPTSSPPPSPTQTPPPPRPLAWWDQSSPFGVQWSYVTIAGVVFVVIIVFLISSCMMMMSR